MAKYPAVGGVKTRLGEDIGYLEAAELYICFLRDIVEKTRQLGTSFFIYYTPCDKEGELRQILGEDLQYVPQRGADLGERLLNGFMLSKEMGYSSAIALASDIPDIPVAFLVDAVRKLELHESILGPSPDGGYYLIGLQDRAVSPRLFTGVNWSTETVFDETVEAIHQLGLSSTSIEAWSDVDDVADLERLRKSDDPEFKKTSTWRYLKSIQR